MKIGFVILIIISLIPTQIKGQISCSSIKLIFQFTEKVHKIGSCTQIGLPTYKQMCEMCHVDATLAHVALYHTHTSLLYGRPDKSKQKASTVKIKK